MPLPSVLLCSESSCVRAISASIFGILGAGPTAAAGVHGDALQHALGPRGCWSRSQGGAGIVSKTGTACGGQGNSSLARQLRARRQDVHIGFECGMGYMKCCATYLMCPQFEIGEVPGMHTRFGNQGPPPPCRGRAIVSSARPAAARARIQQCGLVFPDLVPSRLPGPWQDDCEQPGPCSTQGRMSGDEGQWWQTCPRAGSSVIWDFNIHTCTHCGGAIASGRCCAEKRREMSRDLGHALLLLAHGLGSCHGSIADGWGGAGRAAQIG
ncbi:hypothetical protein B0H14DRAFT_2584129 [Mycena olivaceomarginata]|nr:hypothetical protein B0H14DRAFT_2584129 [Mycena olivaceomarginata]